MPELSNDQYFDQLRASSATLESTPADHLGAPIPHIDGWTVGAVIGHTGWVSRFVTLALDSPADRLPSRSSVPEPPQAEELIAWFGEARNSLLEKLAESDLAVVRPTFVGPQPARWWLRRLAHETSIHAWDAASATGSPPPISPELALDGVDELFEVFAPVRLNTDLLAGSGETVHLHATDVDSGEWMITLNPDGVEVEYGHAKGDVAVRGPISDLLLLLWSRIPPSRLEVFGDSTILDRWQSAATF